MTARIIHCSESEYLADPCDRPSLSASAAKTLIMKSPLHCWAEHPRLGAAVSEDADVEDDSAALKHGKVIHKLLLGKGAEIAIVDAKDWRTNAAKEQRDKALAAGHIPLLTHKFAELNDASECIKRNLLRDYGIDLAAPGGESELAIEWYDDGADGPVLCRCRMDRVYLDSGLILDVKSIRSADPETCGRHAVEHGHDIQDAAYKSALASLRPQMAGRIQMLFVHVELAPPHAITVGPLDGELAELGRQRWERAVYVWEDCLRTGRWPSYTNRVTPIQGPGYAMTKWLERAQDW